MRIAFVVQRYGPEVNGGAELLCRWVAERLARHHETQVLTTCAQDYIRWENVYRPGEEEINGVRVRRFPVDRPRNWRRFQRLNHRVLTRPHALPDEIEWMRQQGPTTTRLLEAVEQERDGIDAFVFVTYLYFTTYFGLQIVPQRALLVPTAHDEPTLYLPLFRSVFHLPRHIVYNTDAEKDLVQRVFGNDRVPCSVVGTGVNVPPDVQGGRFRHRTGIEGDFLLYAGRIDESKNVGELFETFARFKETHPSHLKLVLMGRGISPIPQRDDVVALGFVPELDKFDAMQAAAAVVVPSRYESLSMAVLEAWTVETPVLVNATCQVLREQCARGNGGLAYAGYEEFALGLQTLLGSPRLRERLGRQGRAYVDEHYSWETVERKYLDAIEQVVAGR